MKKSNYLLNNSHQWPPIKIHYWFSKSLLLFLLLGMAWSPLFSQKNECSSTFSTPEAVEHEKQIAKDLAKFTEDFIKNEQANVKMAPIDIPFRIHIVRQDNGTGGVDYGDVLNEMALVNTRYAPDLNFIECGTVHYINSTQFYFLSGDPEGDLMSATHNTADVLNIYFVGNADGACGWARFTFLLPSDYIVIDNSCATNTSTLAHEIGHYFDLFHTHETAFGAECVDGSNCGVAGDLLCDTPADPNISGNVNVACVYTGADLDPCNNDPYMPDETNIMSYSNKTCRTFFSVEQRARVVFTAMNGRSYLTFNCVVGNDDVCESLPITIGVPINADGATATAQVGEVNPGVGTDGSDGCNATDGWCNYPGNGEPGIHNSLWFTFVAPPSGYVDINTDNSDDAQIAIWSVGDCNDFGTFTIVAANDDSGPGFAPAICTDVIPGNTYYLQIDGFDGFPYNTNITVSEIAGPLANDECINAEPITCGSTIFGNTANACSDPDQLGFCGTSDGVGTGVWYTWTGDGTRVTLTTCNPGTDYDTKIRVWSGSCGALNCVAGNDDTNCGLNSLASKVQFCSTPGEQYFILVHGFQSSEGNFELSMTCDMELVLTCPADISIPCGDPNDPGVAGEATANTNVCCPNPPTITYADVTAANFLSITRTWTATYDCGLELNCDQIITLIPSAFNGNVAFFTQAQVDAWPGCYSTINGHVQINGANITNLNTLQNLTTITGGLTIQSTALSNMNGLDNLANVGGTLTILFNSSLTSLIGMESLASVGGGLYLYYNFALDDCCAIKNLINGGVVGPVVVFFNKVGCNSAIEILNGCGPGMAPLIGNTGGINTAAGADALTTLSLFPNPAKNEVNVEFERTALFATLRLMDMLGRVVFEKEMEEGIDRITIDLNNGQFDNGLYLVSFMENGEMVSKQLVIQR